MLTFDKLEYLDIFSRVRGKSKFSSAIYIACVFLSVYWVTALNAIEMSCYPAMH